MKAYKQREPVIHAMRLTKESLIDLLMSDGTAEYAIRDGRKYLFIDKANRPARLGDYIVFTSNENILVMTDNEFFEKYEQVDDEKLEKVFPNKKVKKQTLLSALGTLSEALTADSELNLNERDYIKLRNELQHNAGLEKFEYFGVNGIISINRNKRLKS